MVWHRRHARGMTAMILPAVTAVAGVSFRQAELREVVEGDIVVVETDDQNPHDDQAVKITTAQGVLLGFIPKNLAPRLRATGAVRWPARVKEVLRGETWGLRVEILPAGSTVSSPRTRLAEAIARGAARIEEPVLEDTELVEEAPVAKVTQVVAPSGRVLGVLVRQEQGRVIAVRDGVEVSFPIASVTLKS